MDQQNQNIVAAVNQARNWKLMGRQDKAAAVNEELSRVSRLPHNSAYASHRLRVLNKIKHLLSLQRTTSQDEELELLFAGLQI